MLYTSKEKSLWLKYFKHCESAAKMTALKQELIESTKYLEEKGRTLPIEIKEKVNDSLRKADMVLEHEMIQIVEIVQDLNVENEPMFNNSFFLN